MKNRPITVVPKCECCDCEKPASCRGSYEGVPEANACDECCGHGNEGWHCKPIEIWICGHTVKCGWQGQNHELIYIPDSSKSLRCTTGTCPKCGNNAFWIRPLKSIRLKRDWLLSREKIMNANTKSALIEFITSVEDFAHACAIGSAVGTDALQNLYSKSEHLKAKLDSDETILE